MGNSQPGQCLSFLRKWTPSCGWPGAKTSLHPRPPRTAAQQTVKEAVHRCSFVGPFLSSNFFFQIVLLFFPRKTGKPRNTGNISKAWKINRGQNVWKASNSNIWGEKRNSYGAIFSNFLSFFFSRETGNAGKTGNISKLGNLREGKISGRLRIPNI